MLWLRSRAHQIQSEATRPKLTDMRSDEVTVKRIKVVEFSVTNIARTVIPSYFQGSKENTCVDFDAYDCQINAMEARFVSYTFLMKQECSEGLATPWAFWTIINVAY